MASHSLKTIRVILSKKELDHNDQVMAENIDVYPTNAWIEAVDYEVRKDSKKQILREKSSRVEDSKTAEERASEAKEAKEEEDKEEQEYQNELNKHPGLKKRNVRGIFDDVDWLDNY